MDISYLSVKRPNTVRANVRITVYLICPEYGRMLTICCCGFRMYR